MKYLFKIILIVTLILFCNPVYSDNGQYYFVSYYKNTTINLKLLLNNDDINRAFVQYKGQDALIPVTLISNIEQRRNEGYVSLIQYEYEEDNGGGKYVMVFQGVVIHYFIYLRYSDNMVFCFENDSSGQW